MNIECKIDNYINEAANTTIDDIDSKIKEVIEKVLKLNKIVVGVDSIFDGIHGIIVIFETKTKIVTTRLSKDDINDIIKSTSGYLRWLETGKGTLTLGLEHR